MSRLGDWYCRSCNHLNFQRRKTCQRCGEYNVSGRNFSFSSSSSPFAPLASEIRRGDWYCAVDNCGAHNFASRPSCFKCGAFKNEPTGTGGLGAGGSRGGSSQTSGEWLCTRSGCNGHNFASRTKCYRCNAPRGSS